MSAIKINPETLEPEGTIIMPGTSQTLWLVYKYPMEVKLSAEGDWAYPFFSGQHSDGQNIIFTDGEYINQIAACKDVSSVFLLRVVITVMATRIIFYKHSQEKF